MSAAAVSEVDPASRSTTLEPYGQLIRMLMPRAQSIAIYDRASDTWAHGAPIPTLRDHLTAAAAGGMVYAIAGRRSGNYDVVEAYDVRNNRWSTKARMPSQRGGLGSGAGVGVRRDRVVALVLDLQLVVHRQLLVDALRLSGVDAARLAGQPGKAVEVLAGGADAMRRRHGRDGRGRTGEAERGERAGYIVLMPTGNWTPVNDAALVRTHHDHCWLRHGRPLADAAPSHTRPVGLRNSGRKQRQNRGRRALFPRIRFYTSCVLFGSPT